MVHATSAALPAVEAIVIPGPCAATLSRTSAPSAILESRQYRKHKKHTDARQTVIQEQRAVYYLPRDDKRRFERNGRITD